VAFLRIGFLSVFIAYSPVVVGLIASDFTAVIALVGFNYMGNSCLSKMQNEK